jgi:hypothetical protein
MIFSIRSLWAWLLAAAFVLAGCASPSSAPSSVTVKVTGSGATFEEARKNGFRDAIQQAYGTLMLSERRVTNDQLFEDDVSYARGVIESFRVLSSRVDPKDRQHHVDLLVTVSPTAVQRRLLDVQDSAKIDGRELGRRVEVGRVQAQSEVERYMGARRLFEHVTRDFATSLFNLRTGQVQTIRDGGSVAVVVDVTASINADALRNLCKVAKEYQATRTAAVPASYRESATGLLRVWGAYDCSTEAAVEQVHMQPMVKAMQELGICLKLEDSGGKELRKFFYQPNSPRLVNNQIPREPPPPGLYLVQHYRNASPAIVMSRFAWGNDSTIRLQLPELDQTVLRSISKVTASLGFEEPCSGMPVGRIGLNLSLEGGSVMISRVAQGSPASRAGIRSGDELLQIDGVPVRGMSLDQVLQRSAGKPGSDVLLHLRRNTRIQEYRLTREDPRTGRWRQ